jgi:hypothetical protein
MQKGKNSNFCLYDFSCFTVNFQRRVDLFGFGRRLITALAGCCSRLGGFSPTALATSTPFSSRITIGSAPSLRSTRFTNTCPLDSRCPILTYRLVGSFGTLTITCVSFPTFTTPLTSVPLASSVEGGGGGGGTTGITGGGGGFGSLHWGGRLSTGSSGRSGTPMGLAAIGWGGRGGAGRRVGRFGGAGRRVPGFGAAWGLAAIGLVPGGRVAVPLLTLALGSLHWGGRFSNGSSGRSGTPMGLAAMGSSPGGEVGRRPN